MKRDKEYYRFMELSGLITEDDNKINKLVFFDYDGTLGDSPDPEKGMIQYKEKTGKDWPHKGWWGHVETLDHNIFDFNLFEPIINILNKSNNEPTTRTVILTARVGKFKNIITQILKKFNIHVDDIQVKDENLDKDERIESYIRFYPNLKQIDIYDDREKELVLFKSLKEKLINDIEVNIFQCDKGNIRNYG